MPMRNGFEVLEWIRSQPLFRRLIVTILTTSAEEGDIAQAYNNFANSYLVKPTSLNELEEMTEKIRSYWLETNTMPRCGVEERFV
jgi:CheY-like chemotaxis protein